MAQRSLYEALNGSFTTVAKTKFFDGFVGKVLNLDNWTLHNIAGSGGTATMLDGINTGCKLVTGTSTSDNVQIDFNNKRQFSHTGSKTVGMIKKTTVLNAFMDGGFKAGYGDDNSNLSFLHIEEYSTLDGIWHQTNAAKTDTGTPQDDQWHIYEIELTGSNNTLKLDGTLKSTRTSDLPAAALQPAFKCLTRTGSAGYGAVQYCEAWNT